MEDGRQMVTFYFRAVSSQQIFLQTSRPVEFLGIVGWWGKPHVISPADVVDLITEFGISFASSQFVSSVWAGCPNRNLPNSLLKVACISIYLNVGACEVRAILL